MMYKDVWLSPAMVDEISTATRSHKRTVERWLAAERIPETPLKLLQIIQSGRLEEIHDSWRGWSISNRNGKLRTPTGHEALPGDKMFHFPFLLKIVE